MAEALADVAIRDLALEVDGWNRSDSTGRMDELIQHAERITELARVVRIVRAPDLHHSVIRLGVLLSAVQCWGGSLSDQQSDACDELMQEAFAALNDLRRHLLVDNEPTYKAILNHFAMPLDPPEAVTA